MGSSYSGVQAFLKRRSGITPCSVQPVCSRFVLDSPAHSSALPAGCLSASSGLCLALKDVLRVQAAGYCRGTCMFSTRANLFGLLFLGLGVANYYSLACCTTSVGICCNSKATSLQANSYLLGELRVKHIKTHLNARVL